MNRICLLKKVLILLVPLFSLIALSCNTEKKQRKFIIGFSQCTANDDWRKVMLAEMKRELPFHDNLDFIYKEAGANSERQIQQIEDLVNQHIDLLIVSPNEVKPLSPEIAKVFNSGLPVVVVDRRTNNQQYSAFVGASNFEVGENAGKYAISLLKGKGNILEITGLPDASPVIDRHNGFMEAISIAPQIKFIKKIDANSKPFLDKVKGALMEKEKINLIYAQNDFMAMDAYGICKSLGIEKDIKIIGIDGLPTKNAGLDMVANKYIAATVLYPTGGQEAILTAANILENKPYNKENQLYTTIIDSTNVRMMKLQNEKILEQQTNIDRSQEKIENFAHVTTYQTYIIYIVSISLGIALILGGILFYYLRENRKINSKLNEQNTEILTQQKQLIALGEQAKEATDAKINFFTNISHEFRTPLTLTIAPLEELLSNPKIHFTVKKDLQLIQKNVIRLLRLVNQLIDFRKLDANKMKLKASENDFVQFAHEIIESFKPMAKKKNIDLNVFTKERSIMAWFDVSMIDKVMFNLLSNAFKFTNENGYIHITLEKKPIENQLKIRVEDNGIGMDAEATEHAFELFYQGNITTQQGSGLGLALSKELIELHQGKITVTSKPGKGACFEIILPLGADHIKKEELQTGSQVQNILYSDERLYDIKPDAEMDDAVEHSKEGILNAHTLLIVEDNEDLRNFIAEKLSSENNILTADNGNTAIQLTFENIPDLIICDIGLPGKDGIAITNILKNDFRTSHIPIILLTAKDADDKKIEGMKSMADAYIVKPFNLNYLNETIKSLMKNREILKEHFTSELPIEMKSQTSTKMEKTFIHQFISIIESNISNDKLTVDDISQAMNISRIQLYRKVKALIGYSVNDYLLNVRLQKAKHYLNEGELNISEIAFKVGFGSSTYFSTVFKSKFTVTPTEYRDKKRPKNG